MVSPFRGVHARLGAALASAVCCTPSAPGDPATSRPRISAPAPASDAASADAPTPTSREETKPPPAPAPAPPRFDRIRWTDRDESCHPVGKGDCVSALDISADGTIVLDPWGDPGAAPVTATLTAADLAALSAVFTGAPFLETIGQAEVCEGADGSETMMVVIDGVEHRNDTGMCNDDAIYAARGALFDVAFARFPGRYIICPPV